MITLLVGLAALASPAPEAASAKPREVVVYAAASLRDALQEMAPVCEGAVGAKILFNFGASNDLARQIQAGHKADVFFSADESWMDKVAADGLVDAASRRVLLSNRLVIVAAPGVAQPITGAADLARAPARFISMADPEAVPAGRYAKAWLVKQGQWEAVRPRVLPGVDARAALAAVESGGAEFGIVYGTDADLSRKARVVFTVPASEGPIIRYPIAAMRDRPNLETSQAVVGWMSGPEAGRVFERFGFILVEEP